MPKFGHKIFYPLATVCALSIGGLALAACEEEGPAEEAGEAVDEAVNDAARAVEDATD